MSAQLDIYGVITHFIFHGSKKDVFIYMYFYCMAPLIDLCLGRTSPRKEFFGTREEIQPPMKFVCFLQILLFSAMYAFPILAQHLSADESTPGWASMSTAALMPFLCLFGATNFTKKKLFYSIAVLALTLFALPGTGIKEILPWLLMLCGCIAEILFYIQQRRYGEFRVEVALGSALVFSVLYIFFGTSTNFEMPDMQNLFAFILFAWMYQQAKSRYSMNVVDSDPFLMSMVRLEKVVVLLCVAFMTAPASYRARGSIMACLFVGVLCYSAAKKK